MMTYFRQLCCASDAFRGSGNYLLSMILHLKLKTMFLKVKNQSEEMQALIIRNQVLLHQIFFRYLKKFKFKKIYRSIQNYIQSLLQKHSSLLLKSGNYYIFQQMQLWSERYDIDSQYSKDAETNTIPEPEFGYMQLFFNLGMLMDFRFRLRRKKTVDNDDYNLARKYVDDAKKLGITPEIWKLLMLIQDKFPLNFTSADNKLLWATFMSCQYTLVQRFEKILSRG